MLHSWSIWTDRVNKSQPAQERIITEKRRKKNILDKLKLYVVVPCPWDLVDQPWLSIILLKTHYATCYATRLDFLVDHVTRTWSRSYMDKGRDAWRNPACLEPASQDERQGKFLFLPFELINHRVKERALLQLESMRAPFFNIYLSPLWPIQQSLSNALLHSTHHLVY